MPSFDKQHHQTSTTIPTGNGVVGVGVGDNKGGPLAKTTFQSSSSSLPTTAEVVTVMEEGTTTKNKNKNKTTQRRLQHHPLNAAAAATAANDDDASTNTSVIIERKSLWFVTLLIILLGIVTSTSFLIVGIKSSNSAQEDEFIRSAQDLINKIQSAWEDYVTAASWIHGRCRDRKFDRIEFHEIYEYLIATTTSGRNSGGLDFQAIQFDPNITHFEREYYENEARLFYEENYPHINYRGFVGFNYDNSTSLEPRNNASYYLPIHYMEPIIGNEAAIDLDYHASGSRKRTVLSCMTTGQPALTDRLTLVQETESKAFGVVLMHPGVNLTTQNDIWPKDLASIVIRIPDLINRAASNQGESSEIYIYDMDDSSSSSESGGKPLFLGAAQIINRGIGKGADLNRIDEIELDELESIKSSSMTFEGEVQAANKVWLVHVHALPGTFESNHTFVILGGCIIFVASLCVAWWVYSNTRRMEQFNSVKAASEAERAALILDNANQATKAERELNDFIAHEVRNPVAAAMAATSFVKASINETEPLKTVESQEQVREDMDIIDNALKFVNDLLRNMLDMHKASSKQLKIDLAPTDLLHDVLEPVHSLLHQRGSKVKVLVDCPKDIVVLSDRLRLKQVLLNLARNSVKFVEEGFVRLKVQVVDDLVELSVEDSGVGIPEEKRKNMFHKFQESLDQLSQGTGIGLHLCKNLVSLMGGDIWLDEDYRSGIKEYPGARIVVSLNQSKLNPSKHDIMFHHDDRDDGSDSDKTDLMSTDYTVPRELPDQLSVLFVDDDPILRKLFIRTSKTVAPNWNFREASNGETALQLVDAEKFDMIFVDMYMASVEKSLLGTETVQALRQKGVKCKICGLSANDKQLEFLEAGADTFTFKPFPCEKHALTQELCRILFATESHNHVDDSNISDEIGESSEQEV